MDKLKKYTGIFIGLTIALIAIYDVWVMAQGGRGVSISHTMIEWSYKYPAFPFLMGMTMGHLFWRMRGTKELDKITRPEENRQEEK